MLEALISDIRFACRWLRKSPGFTSVAVASLAIGIGFNTALFVVADALLFRPLPVSRPDRLVDVCTRNTTSSSLIERFGTSSYLDYLDLRAHNEVFDDLIGYSPMFATVNHGEQSRLTVGEIVTGNYFSALGVRAATGRTIRDADDRPDAAPVAMVSYRYWVSALGSVPDVIGSSLTLRGTRLTVIGVTPRGFNGMTSVFSPDLWLPMSSAVEILPFGMREMTPSPTGTTRLDRRGDRWLFMRGRLKTGSTVDQARANLDLLMSRLETANPVTNKNRRIAVQATSSVHVHPAVDPRVMPIAGRLMMVVGLVLLIACANVASMLLARASIRRKEFGIRLALGATRSRLMRQLVTESLVLAAMGAVVGVVLAWWLARALESLSLPTPLPFGFDLRIDRRALLFTSAASLVAGVLAGLAPALRASRPNLVGELRAGVVVARTAFRRWPVRDLLVAMQFAITAPLLIVAALLTRSLVATGQANVGFHTGGLALVATDTAMVRYSDERSRQFYEQALARLRALPGTESVALATRVPFSLNFSTAYVWVPGRHRPDQPGDLTEQTRVTPDYFKTIGVRILQGRGVSDVDRPDTPRVAVINETFARKYWPGESPLGKTFHVRSADSPPVTVVGMTADHKVTAVDEDPTPFFHMARAQQPNSYSCIIARTHGDAATLLRNMRRELLALEPNLVFLENQTMAAEVETTLFPLRARAWLVGAAGLVAMTLAAVGLYGVIAYSVARRTREIGIRMALGALPASVVGLIMRQGLAVALAGLGVGCVLAFVALQLMAGALYGVRVSDPISWGGAAGLLLGASVLANLVPARRAARVDPSAALRTE